MSFTWATCFSMAGNPFIDVSSGGSPEGVIAAADRHLMRLPWER